ncbi:hypothetical protein ACFSTA_13730 [Ornithinibacillus salinisoli]|uniref:Uncharacterized protein n=1 Tax=Ornithinibacillus salinisoli TaxID=1848459 RepID=A0ABW4W2L2_9BACI
MHVDSCGRKGFGETPQCVARGGSPAARGKRSVFLERGKGTYQHIKLMCILHQIRIKVLSLKK